MATISWKGGGAAVAQVQSFTFAGTVEVGDIIRVQVGVKIWDYAVTSTVIATFLPLFVVAYNALDADDYPEMAELTAASVSPVLTFTANEAGVPFTVTLTPLESNAASADAQTIEGAGVATTGTATTASAGKHHWDTAANWSGGAVPVSSDSVYLEDSDDDIKYGFAQSAVTLTLFEIRATFTGTIGLPVINSDAAEYPEYRTRGLAISATTCNVGSGVGQGSGRLNLNFGSVQTALTVFATGSPADDDTAALCWKGTHASNVVNVWGNSTLDVARFAGEVATIATLRIENDATVYTSTGTTLTTILQNGGSLSVNGAFTTLTKHGGNATALGSGAMTTVTNNAGTFDYLSTGTITTYVGGPASVLSRTAELRAATITNCTILAGATIEDAAGALVFTNGIILSRCKIADVSLDVGFNRTISVA